MRCFSIYLAASLVLASAIAQDKPNFSGRWVLDTQKSDFGGAPEPLMQVTIIDHKEPTLKITQTIKGDAILGGEATNERQYTTDGKETTKMIGGREVKSVTKWVDNKLVTTTMLETPDGTAEIRDTWELADAGKQMLVTRSFKASRMDHLERLVFTDQK
jgi:hypothetical protein